MTMLDFILFILNWAGLIVFAASGALAAVKHRMDLIGYILLGVVTALGGGTFRDLILDRTIFWSTDTSLLWVTIATSAFVGIIAHESKSKFSKQSYQKALEWADALGLSIFAITGTLIAHNMSSHFIVSLACGMMTATGGGIIRDILVNEKPFITQSELYASAAALGSIAVLILQNIIALSPAILIALFTTFTLRGGAILWGWRPPFSPKS